MAFHDYLGEILGSKAGIQVLKTLVRYRGKVFTMRDLARTAGLSHPEVSLVVRNLERWGVVRLQPVGRAQQVLLNEESYVLNSIVRPAIKAEEGTLKALMATIRPFLKGKPINSAAVFGSAARGLERKRSDVDLLVIAEDGEVANEKVARASAAAVSKFGTGLSPLIMDKASFASRKNDDLAKSILGAYKMVCGKDLKEV